MALKTKEASWIRGETASINLKKSRDFSFQAPQTMPESKLSPKSPFCLSLNYRFGTGVVADDNLKGMVVLHSISYWNPLTAKPS